MPPTQEPEAQSLPLTQTPPVRHGAQSAPPQSTSVSLPLTHESVQLNFLCPMDADCDTLQNDWETQFGLDPGDATGDNGATGDPESFAAVRAFVGLYQHSATLHRTAIHDAEALWSLYPDAIALVRFPSITPQAILHAADSRDFLPPGISRHIVHGRAIRAQSLSCRPSIRVAQANAKATAKPT